MLCIMAGMDLKNSTTAVVFGWCRWFRAVFPFVVHRLKMLDILDLMDQKDSLHSEVVAALSVDMDNGMCTVGFAGYVAVSACSTLWFDSRCMFGVSSWTGWCRARRCATTGRGGPDSADCLEVSQVQCLRGCGRHCGHAATSRSSRQSQEVPQTSSSSRCSWSEMWVISQHFAAFFRTPSAWT